MCKPDHAEPARNDYDDIRGCEKYRFAHGLDEMAINAEMGLYLKFDQYLTFFLEVHLRSDGPPICDVDLRPTSTSLMAI